MPVYTKTHMHKYIHFIKHRCFRNVYDYVLNIPAPKAIDVRKKSHIVFH